MKGRRPLTESEKETLLLALIDIGTTWLQAGTNTKLSEAERNQFLRQSKEARDLYDAIRDSDLIEIGGI